MSKDSEKIDEIFQIHENETKTGTRSQSFSKIHMKTGLLGTGDSSGALPSDPTPRGNRDRLPRRGPVCGFRALREHRAGLPGLDGGE